MHTVTLYIMSDGSKCTVQEMADAKGWGHSKARRLLESVAVDKHKILQPRKRRKL
jgi:hypothetical protein